MLKKSIFSAFCLGFISMSSMAYGLVSDDITYDWLVEHAKETSHADHIPNFKRLFNTIKVRGFLECGCSYSTKYFIDNCDKVISIDFVTPGTSDFWLKECLKLFGNCKNWTPVVYNADQKDLAFYKACAYACSIHKDYALIDPSYLRRLDLYFKKQIHTLEKEGNEIDVAFVDAGVYIRGDMVKLLLENNVPIVIGHGTACDFGSGVDEGYYSWFVVKPNDNYEKIYIPFGQGTTFWISKNLPKVIESITAYRMMIIEKISYEQLTELADTF